ncbi:hypothetical protein [Symmachiella dynata]|mgnify:CR=1 FL=1|uniref:TubC N-terminal docking domain-related protein n=1 Tax=Symmachiella dynata TaxID=2527995 RepID=UPI003C6F67B1
MITSSEILADCESLGVKLLLIQGGGLAIDAPRDALTPQLLDRLKSHKAAICDALRSESASTSLAKQFEGNAIDSFEQITGVDKVDWFEQISDHERKRLLGKREFPPQCRYCLCRARHWSTCPTRRDDLLTKIPAGRFKGHRLDKCPNSYLRRLIRSDWRWVSTFLRNEAERIIYLRTHFGTTE